MACLSRTIWSRFSLFFIFCFYFTCLKAREISRQNMRNSENNGHIVLGTMQQLMLNKNIDEKYPNVFKI